MPCDCAKPYGYHDDCGKKRCCPPKKKCSFEASKKVLAVQGPSSSFEYAFCFEVTIANGPCKLTDVIVYDFLVACNAGATFGTVRRYECNADVATPTARDATGAIELGDVNPNTTVKLVIPIVWDVITGPLSKVHNCGLVCANAELDYKVIKLQETIEADVIDCPCPPVAT